MNYYFTIIFLCFFGMNAQNISKINKDLKLSDSLTYPTEIRMYKGGGITNYTSAFRMYKTKKEKWKAEFFEHFNEVTDQAELKTTRKKLTATDDMEFVYRNLLRSYILELPSSNKIQWKLEKRGKKRVELKVGDAKSRFVYESATKRIAFLDGHIYTVQIQSEIRKKSHTFSYDNPESYLKHFPEVDELIYINEILETVKNQFDIWKK
ncbi:MAG: hypothetical protein AB8B65_10220 [Kordia sp.]|uniref:hypothetical protein n=1 Tax=Kordia sp. TaxID=1965332 RepID=UPI003858458A